MCSTAELQPFLNRLTMYTLSVYMLMQTITWLCLAMSSATTGLLEGHEAKLSFGSPKLLYLHLMAHWIVPLSPRFQN